MFDFVTDCSTVACVNGMPVLRLSQKASTGVAHDAGEGVFPTVRDVRVASVSLWRKVQASIGA